VKELLIAFARTGRRLVTIARKGAFDRRFFASRRVNEKSGLSFNVKCGLKNNWQHRSIVFVPVWIRRPSGHLGL
jgi:hypothetical protein